VTRAAGIQPAFVVGTGRCGSTLLSRAISLCTQVASFSECLAVLGADRVLTDDVVSTSEFIRMIAEPSSDQSAWLSSGEVIEELSSHHPPGSDLDGLHPLLWVTLQGFAMTPAELLHRSIRSLGASELRPHAEHMNDLLWSVAQRLGRRTWIERSGGSLAYVDRLVKNWPAAKFVHIWRAGEACAKSMERHQYFRVLVARATTRRPTLPVEECLKMQLPVDRFGAYWSACLVQGVRVLGTMPADAVLHVSYDVLCQHPVQELEKIGRFLGLGEDWPERAAHLVRKTRSQKTPCERLHRVCRLGYAALARAELGNVRGPAAHAPGTILPS
jgi:hypothetical protein